MSTERAKPFVAWMGTHDRGEIPKSGIRNFYLASQEEHRAIPPTYTIPVVVTPLLPDDPRPGETWQHMDNKVTILSTPYSYNDAVFVRVDGGGYVKSCFVKDLRRPAALKKYCLPLTKAQCIEIGIPSGVPYITVEAESKKAALDILAASIEEVTP